MSETDQPQGSIPNEDGTKVSIRIDESDLQTCYTNGFRTNLTPEEVMLDFGLNLMMGDAKAGDDASTQVRQMSFKINQRVIMNYTTAKRLAVSLGQIIQRHEQQFGELKLNPGQRRGDSL